jgi:RimJ/RimL family protein N-acetyltransferase
VSRASSSASARVELREVVESDLPCFYEHQRDPDANRMAAFPARDRAAFDAHWARILADASSIKLTVVVEGEVAGNVLSWASGGDQLVGYWIDRAHWNKGIATRALTLFLRDFELRPLRAHVAKHNLGSIRVLEKCGFVALREEEVSDEHGQVTEIVFELGGVAPRGRSSP